MRKLLHLVFAVWKTNRPFDAHHFPWEQPGDTQAWPPLPSSPLVPPPSTANETAVGHKRDIPDKQVVTTATSNVAPPSPPVNPPATRPLRPRVDYAFLRQQITLERVLRHLGLLEPLHGSGQQRRGPCPIHGHATDRHHTFSVHLGKNVFQCFQADCAVHGNVLDFWAKFHRVPLYEAALQLADTFGLLRNREEEPVK
jgi:hypothetical protein